MAFGPLLPNTLIDSKRSRVYESVGCPSVCLSVPDGFIKCGYYFSCVTYMLPIVKLRLEAKTIECLHFEQLPSFYHSVINVVH